MRAVCCVCVFGRFHDCDCHREGLAGFRATLALTFFFLLVLLHTYRESRAGRRGVCFFLFFFAWYTYLGEFCILNGMALLYILNSVRRPLGAAVERAPVGTLGRSPGGGGGVQVPTTIIIPRCFCGW
jgi:hypothetical protein